MKRYLSVCFFFIAGLILSANAQSKFELGIISGPEWSIPISNDKNINQQYKAFAGCNVALRLRHNFNRMFSMIGGFEYARIYFNNPSDTNYFGNISYRANQLRIPILFQMNLGSLVSQFFFNVGPTFLYSFGDNRPENYAFPGDFPHMPTKAFPSQLIFNVDMGWMFGFGYSHRPLPWLKFFGEFRLGGPFMTSALGINKDGNSYITLSCNLGLSFTMPVPKKKF